MFDKLDKKVRHWIWWSHCHKIFTQHTQHHITSALKRIVFQLPHHHRPHHFPNTHPHHRPLDFCMLFVLPISMSNSYYSNKFHYHKRQLDGTWYIFERNYRLWNVRMQFDSQKSLFSSLQSRGLSFWGHSCTLIEWAPEIPFPRITRQQHEADQLHLVRHQGRSRHEPESDLLVSLRLFLLWACILLSGPVGRRVECVRECRVHLGKMV
jgi:hypothetical protein